MRFHTTGDSMNEAREALNGADPDLFQRRMLSISREALEGSRPLSDLLGDAFAQLRSMLACVRSLDAELRRRESDLHSLRAKLDASSQPEVSTGPARRLAPDFLDGQPGVGSAAFQAWIRLRIASGLHLGTVSPGDRLPSIRELSRRYGVNHKVVRRVYRELEGEGFVTAKPRSGIYVAEVEADDGPVLDPAGRWVAGFLAEAERYGMGATDLPLLFERFRAGRTLRCACVDSAEDDRFALCREVSTRFGLDAVPVDVDPGRIAAGIDAADIVVTTPFHVRDVRRHLPAGRPVVVAGMHPDWSRLVEGHAGSAMLPIVCVDPTTGDRIRTGLGRTLADRVRVVSPERFADEVGSGTKALATECARERMGTMPSRGDLTVPPYLAPATAGRLARLVVGMTRD
jgi:GntR family transcriptional regulator